MAGASIDAIERPEFEDGIKDGSPPGATKRIVTSAREFMERGLTALRQAKHQFY